MERLTGLDASFLYMETPQVQMHVGFACVFSPENMPGGYSFHTISQRIARAASGNGGGSGKARGSNGNGGGPGRSGRGDRGGR